MRAISSHLEAKGYQVCSLTVSGWTASAKNLSEAGESLVVECAKSKNMIVVIDLWSNSVTRYIQADDRTALVITQNGRWHMPGEVTYSTDTELEAMLAKAVPVLKKITNPKLSSRRSRATLSVAAVRMRPMHQTQVIEHLWIRSYIKSH